MAKLIYGTISSLDGYVADSEGNFDWSAPDDEVHSFVNNLERQVGTYLCGRRMYEVMATGRPRRPAVVSRQPSGSTRRFGRQPTRSSTQGVWRRFRRPVQGSNENSTRRRFRT
jgi:dihydrofolate reductase